jgi:hypothetical protein
MINLLKHHQIQISLDQINISSAWILFVYHLINHSSFGNYHPTIYTYTIHQKHPPAPPAKAYVKISAKCPTINVFSNIKRPLLIDYYHCLSVDVVSQIFVCLILNRMWKGITGGRNNENNDGRSHIIYTQNDNIYLAFSTWEKRRIYTLWIKKGDVFFILLRPNLKWVSERRHFRPTLLSLLLLLLSSLVLFSVH